MPQSRRLLCTLTFISLTPASACRSPCKLLFAKNIALSVSLRLLHPRPLGSEAIAAHLLALESLSTDCTEHVHESAIESQALIWQVC